MNVYDQAHALARAIRESDEYKAYTQARDAADENETNRALLAEYRKLRFQFQVAMAGGSTPDPDEMERFQKIAGLLQFSPDTAACLMAELRVQSMVADIYKIIGEAADIHLDALE